MKRRYPLIIEGAEGDYSAYFPDLPGCTTGGTTVAEVLENAHEALSFYLEGFSESGRPVPEPTQAVRMEFVEVDSPEVTAPRAGEG